jgi:hypothetical protein
MSDLRRTSMTFACIAEAVAYFYHRGYITLDSSTTETRRVMYKPGQDQLLSPMVEIMKMGFLEVKTRHL